MDFRPGELVTVRAGSHWPELVGRIQMNHAQGQPIWLAVLDVDIGDVLGVPTFHVIGKLEYLDPAPMEWLEPADRWRALALRTGRGWGSFTPIDQARRVHVGWQLSTRLPHRFLGTPEPTFRSSGCCRQPARGARCKAQTPVPAPARGQGGARRQNQTAS